MPYDFYVPTDPVDWTRVTLNENGDLEFHDYDLEVDIVYESLGGDKSLVIELIDYWQDDPIGLLCSKHLAIPINDCGIAAWSWAREAVDRRSQYGDFEHHSAIKAALDHALAVSFYALTKSRIPFRFLIMSQRELANMIAETISFNYGKMVKSRTGDAMMAVKELIDGIIQMVQDVEHSGYIGSVIPFCDVAISASNAIGKGKVKESWERDYSDIGDKIDFFIELAVSKMGEVQRSRGDV